MSGINLVFTLVALWLVDKAGRRTLLIAGTVAQAVAFRLRFVLFYRGLADGIWSGSWLLSRAMRWAIAWFAG